MANPFPTRAVGRLADAALGPDDAELLRRYRDAGDPEAFAVIVRRHGRTVLGTCRRVLADLHAAEDAFQATFLQLARKARTLHSPAALAAWLHATARRTALRHRRPGPPPADPPIPSRGPLDALTARELLAAIDDEIARLPDRYRLPLILCYLDGLSKRQAADRLGLSVGAFCGRLDRGREKLRSALVRRGLAPAAGLGLLAPLAESASADLIRRTVGICARGEPAPAAVAFLAASRPGVLTKVGLVAGLVLLGGLGLVAAAAPADPPAKPEPPPPAVAQPRVDLYGDPLPPDALARMGSVRWRHRDPHGGWIDVVPSPTGQLAATVRGGMQEAEVVRVWALPDGRPVCELPWEDPVAGAGLEFTPDGSRLMVLAPRGVVKFYDPRTGQRLAESKPVVEKDDVVPQFGSHRGSFTQHRLVGDGRWVVTTDRKTHDGKATLTEVATDPGARPRQVELERLDGQYPYGRDRFISGGNSLWNVTYDQGTGWKPRIHRWDVRTGRLVGHVLLPTNNMAVAWSRDGKRVATWRHDVPPTDELRVWDTETGAEVVPLEGASRKDHFAMQFSPDGNRLIAQVGRTKTTTTVAVWELGRGKEVGRLTVPAWCNEFDLLPDGKTVLAADQLGMLFGAWDLATGRRLSPVIGHESAVQNLAFSPDGTTLLTASADPDEKVTAWDAATGKRLRELAAPGGYSYNLTRWSNPFVRTPAGAVVTTSNGTLVWTDAQTGRELRRLTPGPIAAVLGRRDSFKTERLAPTHDPRTGRPAVLGLHVFGPSQDDEEERDIRWKEVATLWDAESGELLAQRTDSWPAYHRYPMVLSPDGQLIAGYSYDPAGGVTVDIRPTFGGRGSVRLPRQDDEAPHGIFTHDGQTLITVSRKRTDSTTYAESKEPDTVRLWEVRTGKKRLEFTLPLTLPPTGPMNRWGRGTLAVSADGRFLAVGGYDVKAINVWDLATGRPVATRTGHGSPIQTMVFRPDGHALASGHIDGTALVWDLSGLPGVVQAAADREAAWRDLGSADAGTAYRAILVLAADAGGVAFLRDRVKPAAVVPADRVRELVRDLDANDFATREAATRALKKVADVTETELRAALRGELSAEQQRRIADVLESRRPTESDPDRLRVLRAVEVLERIDSAEAMSLLGELAKGAPGARLTGEAAGALRRRGMPLR